MSARDHSLGDSQLAHCGDRQQQSGRGRETVARTAAEQTSRNVWHQFVEAHSKPHDDVTDTSWARAVSFGEAEHVITKLGERLTAGDVVEMIRERKTISADNQKLNSRA